MVHSIKRLIERSTKYLLRFSSDSHNMNPERATYTISSDRVNLCRFCSGIYTVIERTWNTSANNCRRSSDSSWASPQVSTRSLQAESI